MTRFLLPLFLLFGCCVVSAQNPLAADPFSGSFQNEQMKLELARKGPAYAGVILLGGQSLPVQAKAAGGKLDGTFVSGGQTYSFQATRNGTQLSFVTDGTTHVLNKAVPAAPETPAAKPASPPQNAPAFVGNWQSASGVVRILADGTAAIGEKTHKWKAEGSVITFEGDGQSLAVPFELSGDTWTWRFPAGQLVLTRITAELPAPAKAITGSWQGPTGAVQLNLDGTASVGGVVYRYTMQGNQLTLTGPDGTFVATVQVSGDTMTWAVNGKTLQFQRASTAWAVSGAAGIQPELVGRWCDTTSLNNSTGNTSRSACITLLADGTYQYQADFDATGQTGGAAYGTSSSGSDTGTWTATGDSITSNSKKTGSRTFRLEKRNHPKTGDPMLVLDGKEYTTTFKKAPW